MFQDTKNANRWSFIGKIGVLVALIWGVLQIYSYISKVEDFQAKSTGTHNYYQSEPVIKNGYYNSVNYKSVLRTIIDEKGELKDYHLDTLVSEYKNNPSFELYQLKYCDKYLNQYGDYNEIWTLKIVNNGTKPLEEIALELPFGGSYSAIFPDNKTKSGSFKNRIELGELRSSYEIIIYCWRNNDYYNSEQDEVKSRFTHKNGWFAISYPTEIDGIYAWAKKYSELVIIGMIVMSFIIFLRGITVGEKSVKKKEIEKNEPEKEEAQE